MWKWSEICRQTSAKGLALSPWPTMTSVWWQSSPSMATHLAIGSSRSASRPTNTNHKLWYWKKQKMNKKREKCKFGQLKDSCHYIKVQLSCNHCSVMDHRSTNKLAEQPVSYCIPYSTSGKLFYSNTTRPDLYQMWLTCNLDWPWLSVYAQSLIGGGTILRFM